MSNPLLFAVSSSDTTLTVTGPIASPASGGLVMIDSEIMAYVHATDTQYLQLTRGFAGTSAASHAIGAAVTLVLSLAPDLQLHNNVVFISGSSAPVNAQTGANFAGPGSIYIRTSDGTLFSNTGSLASPTWTLIDAGVSGGITQLTGDVTAGPGSGSQSTSAVKASDNFIFYDSVDPTKTLKTDLSGESTGVRVTVAPIATANETLNVRPLVDATGNILVQNGTSHQVFIGADATIGGSNSGIQYSDATVANRGQIKLHSYFNGASIAGVSTLTSRSGVVGTNAALVNGQDYSKWTAQAAATTPGSAPISGTFAFKVNTVNSLTVTSDFHLQLTNLAGTLADCFYITSEGTAEVLGGLNVGALSVPVASAILQATSTTKGFLPPVMTTAQRTAISSPAEGLLVYDTTLFQLWEYQNGAWAQVGGSSGITQLTGDVTAGPGSGSQVSTLATVNSNVGSFTSANITVNAKGLITAASNGSGGSTPNTGYSISFPTVSAIGTAAAPVISNLTNFSLSFWILQTDDITTTLVGNTDNNTNFGGFVLVKTAAGALTLNVFQNDGSADYVATTTQSIGDGIWHHVLLTYNIVSGALFYFDGKLTPSSSGTAITNWTTTNPMYVGNYNGGFSNGGSEQLARMEIWNTLLSSGNALTLAQGGDVVTGLVASWAFSEGTGTTAADTVGSNTLTFTAVNWRNYLPSIAKALANSIQLPVYDADPTLPTNVAFGTIYFNPTVGSFGAIKFYGSDSTWHTVTAI